MINIREKIGQRIRAARKDKGLTRKGLSELTGNLNPSRINGWERGTRIPGPEEIKRLAEALEVSASYLMCLTDDATIEKPRSLARLVPLLSHHKASNFKNYIDELRNQGLSEDVEMIPLNPQLSASEYLFAFKMHNESMLPEMRVNDIQIVDPQSSPNPGDYVAVKLTGTNEVIICQYKKLSYTSTEFELLTLNDNWPNITVTENEQIEIIGKVIQNIRKYTD